MKKSNLMKSLLVVITSSILFSFFLPIAYSNEIGIFDGMYVKHIHFLSTYPEDIPTTLTWTKMSDDIFHVNWEWEGSIDDTGSWDVNITTRIISNVVNWGPVNHTAFWIYTDASLNDQIIIPNIYLDYPNGEDTTFNITGEAMYGSMAVWQLEDAYGSVLLFEKTKGFLVNGTISHLTNYETFEFVETNAFDPPEDTGNGAIPGYSYLLLVGIIASISIILIIKQKIKK